MRAFKQIITFVGLVLSSSPAWAQEEEKPDVTLTGSVTLATDYRLRGVSQTNKGFTVQGGVTATHKSGLYGGVWASNLAGWGTFGGPNLELDLIGGYKLPLSDVAALDVGLTWYMYPGGASETDFAEPYVKLSGTVGPVSATAGVAYAPRQQALGRWYRDGAEYAVGTPSRPGAKGDNLYVWTDLAAPIKATPLTPKAHLGYSDGNRGLGPNGTSVAPTGSYMDWLIGVDATWRSLTLGVAYIDTDISGREAQRLFPSFSKFQAGVVPISDPTVVVTLTAAF